MVVCPAIGARLGSGWHGVAAPLWHLGGARRLREQWWWWLKWRLSSVWSQVGVAANVRSFRRFRRVIKHFVGFVQDVQSSKG